MKGKHFKSSLAVRHKFLILLLLTLAVIFDLVVRQPSSELLDKQSLPEMPTAR
ncbi:hypothetical protein [Hyella patelloides]|uniref:hypothetical protein n=1 Tax=Hyella patelloides TaxID=1982969 RepID=UPI001643CFC4|nr:hypothetical protein [Hyella patelloides]